MRGSRWKKGRCEMRFMLSCFCIYASWIDLSSSRYSFAGGARSPVWLKVWLKSSTPFEVSVRDIGSNHRKKLIRLCRIPLLALFVSQPPKSFVLFCYIDYVLSTNKSSQRTTTQHGHKISRLIFFFICLSDNKQERLDFLLWIVGTVGRHLKYNKFSYRVSP